MSSEKAFITGSAFPKAGGQLPRLYSMRFCPYAQRTRLQLALKGIEYETINISLTEKPGWLLERNPGGKVPVWEVGDRIVYESLVLAEYLDTIYPHNPIISADPYQKARDAILVESYANKYISGYYKIIFSDGKNEEAPGMVTSSMEQLEDELSLNKTAFFGGEKPAYVDYMIWPWLERFDVLPHYNPGVTMKAHPLLEQWCQNMRGRPEVQKCLLDASLHFEFYQKWRDGDLSAFDAGLPSA